MENILLEIKELSDLMLKKDHSHTVKLSPPVTSSKLKKLAAELKLNDSLLSFYTTANGLFISWFSDVDILCFGKLNIPKLETLSDYLTKVEKTDLKEYSTYIQKGYIPFDVDIINKFITFIKPKKENYEIIRLSPDLNEVTLNCTLESYLNLGIKTGGLYHWQNYISEEVFNHFIKYNNDFFYYLVNTKLKPEILESFFSDSGTKTKSFPSIGGAKFKIPENHKITVYKENLGCSNIEIRRAEIAIKDKLNSHFVLYHYRRNGLEISWKSEAYFANFQMLPLETIFGGVLHAQERIWDNNYFKFINADKSFEKKLSKFYPLIIEEAGDTVFSIENEKINLYIISSSFEPQKINLSFETFIEKLYSCGGISGWQNLFIDEYTEKNPLYKDILKGIEHCFPTLNLIDFLKN
ncbi:hypothetical protein [Flavobacterium lipolyticum]|uniref:Uncharacterized protein n=1 Tax=Flavobacterium lipolyticum TaxID=2893754 RepID=A0ABS8M3C1_9FLAO|nr:hypothetical protein [Flavobacterium sp. F-126]MCC9018696.1 hypothetical protein [Flavobacterium sp. F-126]